MRRKPDVATVAETIRADLAAKGGSRRMLSRTFWKKFGIERRDVLGNVAQARTALVECGRAHESA